MGNSLSSWRAPRARSLAFPDRGAGECTLLRFLFRFLLFYKPNLMAEQGTSSKSLALVELFESWGEGLVKG